MSRIDEIEIRRRLATLAQAQPSAEATERAMDRVRRSLVKEERPSSVYPARLWARVTNSPLTRLAVAAAIIVAAIVGLTQFSAKPAFAEAVRSFLEARTASFKMTMGVQGAPAQHFDCLFAQPIRMRQTLRNGSAVVVSDLAQGRIVTLVPAQKQATVIKLVNMPDEDPSQYNMFAEIQRRITEAQDGEGSAEYLGARDIGARRTIGYHVQAQGFEITVWVDPATRLPVELTYTAGPTTYTMSDIVFNVEIDESLLGLEIPPEYAIRTMQMDASTPTEEDLIQTFRLWAEHADNALPSSLGANTAMEFTKLQMGKIITKRQQAERALGLKVVVAMGRGVMFVSQLPKDSDWHYAGKGVTFGDRETPIFWYRPEGSQTYRVFYADLNVVETPADQLPETGQAASNVSGDWIVP